MQVGTQLKKGILEGCILKLIEKQETYGYKICEDLIAGGFKDISEGTVYPILIRLENKGHISATREVSPLGPTRKVFRLTEAGAAYLSAFSLEWRAMEQITRSFFDKGEIDENGK